MIIKITPSQYFILLSLLCLGVFPYLELKASPPSYLSGEQEFSEDGTDNRDLTDHERWMTENYQHEGYMRRAYEEACIDNGDDIQQACQGLEVDSDFMGLDSHMVKGLAQMYAMIVGSGIGGGFTDAQTDANGNPVDSQGQPIETNEAGELQGEQAEEEVSDNCGYIAMGTEVLGMASQSQAQEQINSTPMVQGNEHSESLYRAARAHDQRSDEAKMQGVGWGATTACYAFMNMRYQGGAQGMIKLAGSALLTMFFLDQVDHHKKYADKMREIADGLPGKGDCNPIDHLDCYCAQPETRYDPKYCLPENYAMRSIEEASTYTTCINDKLQDDPECNCKRTNSCYDEVVKYKLEGMDFSQSANADALKAFNQMTRGELVEGRLDNSNVRNGHRAMARRVLDSLGHNLDGIEGINPNSLNPDQRERAKAFQELGLPPKLAAHAARGPAPNSNQKSRFKGVFQSPSRMANYSPSESFGNSRVMNFSGGRGLDNSRRSHHSSSFDNPFSSMMNQHGQHGMGDDRVLHFRGRAAASQGAQISNRPDHSIFDIISSRYRRSAWQRFDLEY